MNSKILKAFYQFNFMMGLILFVIPFVMLFLKPHHSNFAYDGVKSLYIEEHYIFYKLGEYNGWSNSSHGGDVFVFFIFYFVLFTFYIIPFIISFFSVGSKLDSIQIIKKTKVFFTLTFCIFFFIMGYSALVTSVNHAHPYTAICWLILMLILIVFKLKSHKILMDYFQYYLYIYILLFMFPVFFLILNYEVTILDYQFWFLFDKSSVQTDWQFICVILTPVSYLVLPLFFSLNHYLFLKKLVSMSTKEELPEDFYEFKFSYDKGS